MVTSHTVTMYKFNEWQYFRYMKFMQEYSFLHFPSKGHTDFLERFPVTFRNKENIFQNKKITAEGLGNLSHLVLIP